MPYLSTVVRIVRGRMVEQSCLGELRGCRTYEAREEAPKLAPR